MATPQHPDVRPSGGTSPVPPDNQPGHHPPVDQDKPTGPPPTPTTGPRPAQDAGRLTVRFPFAFSLPLAPAAAAAGVTPFTAHVELDDADFHVRFGPWSLRTPLTNLAAFTVTGPYRWWKVGGPARISLADRGVTFATTTERGVCIRFHEPVAAALPVALIRHPAATVTVADPDGLVAALAERTEARAEPGAA